MHITTEILRGNAAYSAQRLSTPWSVPSAGIDGQTDAEHGNDAPQDALVTTGAPDTAAPQVGGALEHVSSSSDSE